jgi:hypothetical protein
MSASNWCIVEDIIQLVKNCCGEMPILSELTLCYERQRLNKEACITTGFVLAIHSSAASRIIYL